MIALNLGAVQQQEPQEKCRSAEKAIIYYRMQTWKWQDTTGHKRTKTNYPERRRSCEYKRYAALKWQLRSATAKQDYTDWYEWTWRDWLPQVWKNIIQCETASNFRHSNSSYQGAFGFALSSWDSFKLPGYPPEAWQATPRQQYNVALAIYSRYGFSGWGCA